MKVLLAEDDRTSRSFLTAVLTKWGYEPVAVEDGAEAIKALKGPDAPKLAILDWNMPEADGLEVCREMKEVETSNPAYLIILTANNRTSDIVRGLENGASDYICKPFENNELRARLRVGERLLKLQADLNDAHSVLAYQAMHDPLTGIFNRRAALDILSREIANAKRLNHKLSVGICDIDHFKQLNDTYGHNAGDEALKAFTDRVTETLRNTDSLGRWGGEEFIIIAPMAENGGSNVLFERIRKRVEEMEIDVEGKSICFTVSIGVSETSGQHSADKLISSADSAMYEAKNSGRNRVVTTSDSQD